MNFLKIRRSGKQFKKFMLSVSLKNKIRPDNIFLVFGLIAGVILLFLIPPMQVADEWPHFYRVYHLSEGHLFGNGLGDNIPAELHRLMWETDGFMGIPTRGPKKLPEMLPFLNDMTKLRLSGNDETFVPFSTVLYAPVPYAGMVAATVAVKPWTDSPLLIFYAGRLGGLLIAIIMTYWAIKILPFGKWAFLLIAMTPVMIFQRSGISADSFINALSMLYVAYILKLAYSPVKKQNVILLAVLTVAICLCKQAYLALPILIWAIPENRYATSGIRRVTRYGLPLLGWSAAILWAVTAMRVSYTPMIKGSDAVGQAEYIITHPFHYCALMFNDLAANADKYVHELVGTLGWLDIPASNLIVSTCVVLLLVVSLIDNDAEAFPTPSIRILAVVAGILSMMLIFTLMYLWWSPVGYSSFLGMQGRYFTPLLALLPALFSLPINKGFLYRLYSATWFKGMLCIWALIFATDTLFRTAVHYYGR